MSERLALEGGTPVRESFLPFALPSIGEEEIAEVVDTLRSGWLTVGPKTRRFEEAFAEYVGASYAVGVNSCTAALHLCLLGYGIGPGDEVITSPLTFAATGNTVMMVGARPIFVDIEESTYNLDPSRIEDAITKKTRAIIPVHIGGLPTDMEPILKLAERYNLRVIEDAAHAAGARYGQERIGNVSDATCFSFYATKTITTGEGGMITTRSEEFANRTRMLSLHGLSRNAWLRYSKMGSWYYEIVDLGYKYNMTDVQAAIGLCQIKKIESFTRRRREIAQRYDQEFKSKSELILPPRDNSNSEHIYHLYTIRLSPDCRRLSRDHFIEALRAENIGTSVHFIPLHLHPLYRKEFGLRAGAYPKAEAVFNSIISLPIYPTMTDADVHDVIHAVEKIIAGSVL
ncbi:MAG: DegT/DnrJ/EryC1/StrS family aminotransferase [Acidobacteria bacterium]|nr:DegT/DnrJ/EryC1/StrS family aminotransferase [Acidobacteriota bacterium]